MKITEKVLSLKLYTAKISCLFVLLFGVSFSAHSSLIFGFSFANNEGNRDGVVSGRIIGLQDNLDNQQALSIWVDSMPSGLGAPSQPIDLLTLNNTAGGFFQSFSVLGGQITDFNVGLQGNFGPLDDSATFVTFVLNQSYGSGFGTVSNALTFDNSLNLTGNSLGVNGVSFEQVAVPEPTTLGLFGLALLAMRRFRRS
ncbi:PEP-CTERM sorting domain-containing protein [Aliiglaciecola aliphaticivorans]